MGSLRNKVLLGAALGLGLSVTMVDRAIRANPSDPPPAPPDSTEPVTGDPALGFPAPGFETGPIAPFAPSPADPSDVPIEALSRGEQIYVEGNLDAAVWPAVHNAFAAATTQAAASADAQAAANLVGLGGAGGIGVVP